MRYPPPATLRRLWRRSGWTVREWAVIQGLNCHAAPDVRRRSIWMKERCNDWWEHTPHMTFTPVDWRENFRMTRKPFTVLVGNLAPHIAPSDAWIRPPVPVDKKVAIAVYKLASTCEWPELWPMCSGYINQRSWYARHWQNTSCQSKSHFQKSMRVSALNFALNDCAIYHKYLVPSM